MLLVFLLDRLKYANEKRSKFHWWGKIRGINWLQVQNARIRAFGADYNVVC